MLAARQPPAAATHCSGPRHTSNMYKLVEVEGKGMGLVAARNIKKGEIVVEEKPIFALNNDTSKNTVMNNLQEINKMSEKKKKESLALCDSYQNGSNDAETIVSIFVTNRIDLCTQPELGVNKSGLYATLSRINHSCSPNVTWSWTLRDPTKETKQATVRHRV